MKSLRQRLMSFTKRPQLSSSQVAPFLSIALIAGITLAGCSSAPKTGSTGPNPEEKVITVNGRVFTRKDYEPKYAMFAKMFNYFDNGDAMENPMIKEQLKRMTLSKLTYMALLESEAKKHGIQVTPEEVKAMREKAHAQAGGADAFDVALKRSHISNEEFEETLKEQILITKVLEKENGKPFTVSDAEAKAFFEKHPEMFNMPEQIKASHILVKAMDKDLRQTVEKEHPKASQEELEKLMAQEKKELKAEADALFAEIKKDPKQFAKLAQEHSDDYGSAQKGGELGNMQEQTTEPTFWKALKDTPVGKFHPTIVETPFGYHIIKVNGKSPAHKASFEEVKGQIVALLLNEKKQNALEAWAKERQAKAKVVIEPAFRPVDAKTVMQNAQQQKKASAEAGAAGKQ